ncbi:MAG: serine/threonine protein kinase [Myxococcales bacterium]|nr:serine/threonine protein kinase [Myxococcales bacterium]MBL0194195.1 serine/threonine protein kinase [Myxococcales bacterium]
MNCARCQTPLAPGTAVCPQCRSLQRRRSAGVGPGTRIDRGFGTYVVDARLGAGAMGVVWRAWLFFAPDGPHAGKPPQLLALKQLRHQGSLQAQFQTFFLREAEALRRLSHPNVVAFHELFEWVPSAESGPPSSGGATLTLVLEYVEGSTLEDVIVRHVARARLAGPGALPGVPFRRAWYYFEQLLGALSATHALDIVHRDVKPANLLLRNDGIVKLTDFGIARVTAPTPEEAKTAPGTGAYMSPEQVLGQPLDGRSDLYSAAIVLFETLTGVLPFPTTDRTEYEVRRDQVEAPPPPLRAYLPQAPRVLDDLFARALAKQASDRFPTAEAMGEAFRGALGLPASSTWAAQREMSALARPGGSTVRLEQVRAALVQGYRTAMLQQAP